MRRMGWKGRTLESKSNQRETPTQIGERQIIWLLEGISRLSYQSRFIEKDAGDDMDFDHAI